MNNNNMFNNNMFNNNMFPELKKNLEEIINKIPKEKKTIKEVFKTIREWEEKQIKEYKKAEYNSKSGKLYF